VHDREHDDGDDRGEVEAEAAQVELRDEAPEDPQVRVDHVVEEALDPVERDVVGERDPGRDDVGDDADQVDEVQDVDEVPHGVDGGREQHRPET
jgi:hypothetical protein